MSLAHAPAADRNKAPILAVLRDTFAGLNRVLEIGAGTGQHAVHFAAAMPWLEWQTTERLQCLADLAARIAAEGTDNCLPPLELDVARRPWAIDPVDGVFTANTLHIMGWSQVQDFFAGVAEVLPAGKLCVYGPFRYAGRFTTPSNAAFDQSLRSRDPLSGIRDFEAVDELARAAGFSFADDRAMPANNQLLTWTKHSHVT